MENKKEEAIRKAYGEYWERMSPELQAIALRSDGWIQMRDCTKELGVEFSLSQNLSTETHFNSHKQRPKSLQGIENNNGWISIESEEDLPKDSHSLLWVYTDHGNIYNYFFYSRWFSINELEKVVAYQPIVKPKPPVY